jgi:hypothetical protein
MKEPESRNPVGYNKMMVLPAYRYIYMCVRMRIRNTPVESIGFSNPELEAARVGFKRVWTDSFL